MTTIYDKFKELKTSISGNREKTGFEYSFGMPKEEAFYITPMNKKNTKIISEIQFALSLSKYENNEYDRVIEKAIDFLLDCVVADGVLTGPNCDTAEQMLASLEPAAKEWKLILAGHAHIDMNWMWGWQETVAAALSTFRTMLAIMDEYPEFCFSQSQASCYKIVEDYDPELMERIKEKIAEGRWEVSATAWVETDKNMPCTESLLRHIQYTKEYMEKVWGLNPKELELDFSPDTFGHNANVPEINNFGNVKYYYHCRGMDDEVTLYRWRAPSGKEILVHKEPEWYNAAITPHIAMSMTEIAARNAGFKTGLIVYGVGNHGGGPTRRDVENAMEMMKWKIFPEIKFGTIHEYFKIAEKEKNSFPLIEKELNYFSPGCYTTQSRIKMGNKNCERALLQADTFATLVQAKFGRPYMHQHFQKAWQNVLFTHFHDILTGSCVQETREHAMGLYADSMATAQTQTANALRVIADNIDTSFLPQEDLSRSQSEGAGVGYGLDNFTGVPSPERGAGITRVFHLFNCQPYARKEVVELTVWDWVGDMSRIEFKDSNGAVLPHVLRDTSFQQYWDHKYFRVNVEVEVPSIGYATISMQERSSDSYPNYMHTCVRSDHPYENILLENEHLRAEFDFRNGQLISLRDKKTGQELAHAEKKPGLRLVNTEPATSSAWQIGRHHSYETIDTVVKVQEMPKNELLNGFEVTKKVLNSTVKETVTLAKNSKALCFAYEIEWNEYGTDQNIPVLSFCCPLGYRQEKFLYSVPAGIQERGPMNIDVPSTLFAVAQNKEGNSLMLSADTKYGFRGVEEELSCTLINTSTGPDKFPERGIHHIKIYLGIVENCGDEMVKLASLWQNPLASLSGNRHKGTLPLQGSLARLEGEGIVLSAITSSRNGEMIVRCYNISDEEKEFCIGLDRPVSEAVYIDLAEKAKGTAKVEDGLVKGICAAKSIAAVKITL